MAPAAAAYEDRLIDGGNLPVELDVGDSTGHNSAGWPRAMYAETVASRVSRDDASTKGGMRFGGMLDTPAFGAFTIDATVRVAGSEGQESGNMITLMQRGMPISSAWSMNSTLGVTYSPMGDLARRQARFFVPAIQMSGTSVEWQKMGQVQAFASYGEPSVYSGVYIPTVEKLGGRQSGAGLQLNLDDRWSIAAQAVDVSNVPTGLDKSSPRISSRSWFGAVASEEGGIRTQLNVAGSSIEAGDAAAGAWLDAMVQNGRISHSFGGFYLEPELVWGNQQLASDATGGYYRAAYRSRRWTLDGGLDYVSSVSGDSGDVLYGTVRTLPVFVETGLRRRHERSAEPVGFETGNHVRWRRRLAVDRMVRVRLRRRGERLGHRPRPAGLRAGQRTEQHPALPRPDLEHPVGQRLSTSILFGRVDLGSRKENSAGLAVFGGGNFGRNFSIDANARWNKAFGDADSDDLFANLALNWGFARGWTASASYYQNRSDGRFPLSVESPVGIDPTYERLDRNDSGLYLRVRYDWRAGLPTAPLGGSPGMGSGRINGVLFLDENDNGRFDASESGAANVVVLLNGRFAVRTDASGRFEFPSVVAGNHSLSVVSDNLPLAWNVPAESRFDVRVGVRGQSQIELPARRQR